MDHDKKHPRQGKRMLLTPERPDPLGIIFKYALVNVVDWADRHTGMPWEVARASKHPLVLHYLSRMGDAQTVLDADVVAVQFPGKDDCWLVHQSEMVTVTYAQKGL